MAECTAAAATVRVAGEAGEPAAWSVGGAETIYGYLLQLFSFRACLAKKEEEGEEEERREGYNGSTIVRVSQWSTEEKERGRERALVYFGRRSNQESNSGATAMCVLSLSTFFRGNQEEAESSSSPPFSLIALPSLPAAFVESVPPSVLPSS